MSRQSIKPAGLPVIHDRAAGIDIGARFHVVSVAPELCDEAVQTFQAFTGDIERMADWWNISNPTLGMPHPMHIHGFSFQVLERIGSPPQVAATARFGQGRTVSDLGWKDTVLVWPGETVLYRVRRPGQTFDTCAPDPQPLGCSAPCFALTQGPQVRRPAVEIRHHAALRLDPVLDTRASTSF